MLVVDRVVGEGEVVDVTMTVVLGVVEVEEGVLVEVGEVVDAEAVTVAVELRTPKVVVSIYLPIRGGADGDRHLHPTP